MKTLEEILIDGIKDTDWTYCKAEYAPHEGCKIGMPTEYTPDGTTKLCVKTCYIVTAKFADGSIMSSPGYIYLSDGRFYWYDNLWYDTDTVDQEKTDKLWNTPIAWIAYRNVAEYERPYPLAPYNKDANIPTPQKFDVIKENWVDFYILGLSILTAIGKHMIRKHVWKENDDEQTNRR